MIQAASGAGSIPRQISPRPASSAGRDAGPVETCKALVKPHPHLSACSVSRTKSLQHKKDFDMAAAASEKWRYQLLVQSNADEEKIQDAINALGGEGWELVAVYPKGS